jgi:hypothetical protein
MKIGFYSFTPLSKSSCESLNMSKTDLEEVFKQPQTSPAEKLAKIKLLLNECLARKASLEEFKDLAVKLLD